MSTNSTEGNRRRIKWRERALVAEKERDALKAHAEAMYARLVSDYTEGPCVDQHIGAALPAECYAYRHDYPGDGK